MRLAFSDRMVGLVDQGSRSAINFAALILLARWLPVEDFGILALVMSAVVIVGQLQGALLVLPFIVSCPTEEKLREQLPQWLWLSAYMATAVALLLCAIYGLLLVFDLGRSWRDLFWYIAIAGCPRLLQEFCRRTLFQSQRHRAIIAMSVTYFFAFASGLGLIFFLDGSVVMAVFVLGGSSLAGYIAGRAVTGTFTRVSPAHAFRALQEQKSFAGWTFSAFLASSAYVEAMSFIIGGIVGPAGVAVFAATRNFIRPAETMVAAVDSIDKPRAGRAYAAKGMPGLNASVEKTRNMILALVVPYLALVFIFSPEILDLVYGEKYLAYVTELRLWIVAGIINSFVHPFNTKLIILANSRAIFVCRLVGASVTLLLALLTMGEHGVKAAIVAFAVGRTADLLLLMWFSRALSRDPRVK